jgi:hypothetical protein
MQREEKEIEQVKIELEEEDARHSKELEERLDKIHLQLVKACATRKANEKVRIMTHK